MSTTGDTGRSKSEPIHFWTGRFGYDVPTLCGRTEVPKPTTDDWTYVDCAACLVRAPDDVKRRLSDEGAAAEKAFGRLIVETGAEIERAAEWEPGSERGFIACTSCHMEHDGERPHDFWTLNEVHEASCPRRAARTATPSPTERG